METVTIKKSQLDDIQAKLDFITVEMEAMKRHRQELEELRHDLSLIAKDMFNATVAELEDVAPFVQSSDIVHLGKKLLRNTSNLTESITRFEGAIDFLDTASPITKDIFNETLHKLDELDRKGYFTFFNSMMKNFDIVVDSMCPDDCISWEED